jgi:hypothetical protein
VQHRQLADGLFRASGVITRRTSHETGLAGHHTFHGTGGIPDLLIMDERFLAAQVRGRGVTVFSACSHAGVINACLAASDHYPDTPVDLVLGGFHLAGAAMEQRIEATIQDLVDLVQPHIVAPGHCTGWRAKAALAARFAPRPLCTQPGGQPPLRPQRDRGSVVRATGSSLAPTASAGAGVLRHVPSTEPMMTRGKPIASPMVSGSSRTIAPSRIATAGLT